MFEIHSIDELSAYLDSERTLAGVSVQAVDLVSEVERIRRREVGGALFLGCRGPADLLADLVMRGALVLPELPELPFKPYRSTLYTRDDLFDGFDPKRPCSYCETTDGKTYDHWARTGREHPATILDALARRMHDFSMTDALGEFLDSRNRPCVAVMGGHGVRRTDSAYQDVAVLAARLTNDGYLMVSGGGPGAMEAAHLGAYFAREPEDRIDAAISILARAPHYRGEYWLSAAYEVFDAFPDVDEGESVGIPTWLYGHEPPTPFASHIAKYFANSVREEGLVTIAKHGIVFAPGSAGTIQEIFQDLTQNHYGSVGLISPMVLLDRIYWTKTKPVLPLVRFLARGKSYEPMFTAVDTVEEAISFIKSHPPVPPENTPWSFCDAFCR